MNLENIDVFIAVVDAQSFTKAARLLTRPTSTVSAQIAKLESVLGVTLIQRTTRQLRVTEAGQTFYRHCVIALAEMKKAELALSELNQQPSGLLRISAPMDLANAILAPLIKEYCSLYPEVSIELLISNRRADLVKDDIDLALRIGPLMDSSLIARRYLDFQGGFWTSKQYIEQRGEPLAIEQLSEHQLVRMLSIGENVVLWDDQGNESSVKFSGKIATDDIQSCLALVKAGSGIALLPNFIGQRSLGGDALVSVLGQYTTQTISAYFVYPQQQFVPLSVRSFIDYAFSKKENTDDDVLGS